MSKYVPYHKESVQCAKEITKTCKTPLGKYRKIIAYMSRYFVYDYIRAVKILQPKQKKTPDLDHLWKTHMGICLDTASMTTGMLRAVGVNAVLCFGHADGQYHAWVEATINGKRYRYDHDGKAKKYIVERTFT